MLLSDNFDYQTVARDLVPGVLSEQELGSTLYIHELSRVREAHARGDRGRVLPGAAAAAGKPGVLSIA